MRYEFVSQYFKHRISIVVVSVDAFGKQGFPGLPDSGGDPSDERWMREVEVAVIKRGTVATNSERVAQVVEEYLDQAKYEEFVRELKAQVDI